MASSLRRGSPRKPSAPAAPTAVPGVVAALALTRTGAVAATAECMLLSGHGKLILTGNLVEDARDSAQVALSLGRSRAKHFGIDPGEFHHTDAHFHVVEMLPRKAGPSAGLPLFVALVSAMLRKPVDPKLAFTGEISLSGRVHPIEGLALKAAAAAKAGITRLAAPAENVAELKGKKLPKGLTLIPVTTVDEAVRTAFGGKVR